MRPGTGMKGRAPPSSMGRVPTGTARPGSRGGEALAGALNAQIKVADRPMTRQGLLGPKTAARGPQRQVQDKSYYMGQLRAKMTDLNIEIAKLRKEIDQFNQDNSTYLSYEKNAEALASEIKGLQGQLADYNTLVDKLNTDTEMDDIIQDYNALKMQNEREQRSIDEIFTQRQDKENQIQQLEIELDQEHRMAESLVEDMPPDQKGKYAQLKNINKSLQSELEQKQQDLDSLNLKITSLEEEVSSSPIKQEAVSLYEKLNELEEKKRSLLEEMEKENKGSPAEEKERLLKQVKEDNQEIASMDRRIGELKEKIESLNTEIQQLDMDLEEHQGERNLKYKELKKREETMQEFLDSFEENKANELTLVLHRSKPSNIQVYSDEGLMSKISVPLSHAIQCYKLKINQLSRRKELESGVVALLEKMSRGMVRTKHLPTAGELKQMQDDLSFKENEMQKSQATASSLASEHTRLQMDLEKVEQLENKITTELDSLKEKIVLMEKELEVYSDLDALREQSLEKKARLHEEKSVLFGRKDTFKKFVQNLSTLYEASRSKLLENETYSQLGNLERKWQHHEQNNFVMKEFITSKSLESDYRPIKNKVTSQVEELNKLVIQGLGRK